MTTYEQRAKVFTALSDPTRLRMVEQLQIHQELSGSELAKLAGITMALLSHHWKILNEAGLITRRKVGQTQYCSLNRDVLAQAFNEILPEVPSEPTNDD